MFVRGIIYIVKLGMLGESRCINYWTVINRDEHLRCMLIGISTIIDRQKDQNFDF